MSRSNPTENSSHPATRWLEWSGETGVLRYYDKTKKENVNVGDKLTFILLDQLGTIKGWHDASDSGIYSNEVKDTRRDPFIVKAFKGGVLCEGIYANIKDRVGSMGGHFTTNLYIAFRDGNSPLTIGSLQFKGAALREWMEFAKKHRDEIYKKAIGIDGFGEGKKGKITYRTPIFKLRDISEETNEEATMLDMTLQTFLKAYLSRPTAERAAQPANETREHEEEEPPIDHAPKEPEPDDDSIPF